MNLIGRGKNYHCSLVFLAPRKMNGVRGCCFLAICKTSWNRKFTTCDGYVKMKEMWNYLEELYSGKNNVNGVFDNQKMF